MRRPEWFILLLLHVGHVSDLVNGVLGPPGADWPWNDRSHQEARLVSAGLELSAPSILGRFGTDAAQLFWGAWWRHVCNGTRTRRDIAFCRQTTMFQRRAAVAAHSGRAGAIIGYWLSDVHHDPALYTDCTPVHSVQCEPSGLELGKEKTLTRFSCFLGSVIGSRIIINTNNYFLLFWAYFLGENGTKSIGQCSILSLFFDP